ncbi:hypothetical protein EW146_g2628 [Bondarzewia mesenterica]|uniref:Ubiquitin 3 binding protein But2 C-terminal domain-containing protein n=1 Tax=Bondarzewia mesenterica TaxID=1095465 RepID=A0A4S4M2C4_9AGAM|nr:hypothetical protein EW146_g2628 [Bondarzewia mesenterica]
MFRPLTQAEYVPLTSSSEPDSNDDILAFNPAPPSSSFGFSLKTYVFWGLITCFSLLNLSLLPFTLSSYSHSEAQLKKLPYPDQRIGIDLAAKAMPRPAAYVYQWPTHITRLSSKLKNAVYGSGSQVFISVEDTTLMRFPIPPNGTTACAITWTPPPPLGVRQRDLETKGDISEIEVWSVIAPRPSSSSPSASDFDALSWNTRPVRGELLGTLDLTAHPNATTVEFACPPAEEGDEALIVELRCLRVACHVQFMQVPFMPKMGFELVRRL